MVFWFFFAGSLFRCLVSGFYVWGFFRVVPFCCRSWVEPDFSLPFWPGSSGGFIFLVVVVIFIVLSLLALVLVGFMIFLLVPVIICGIPWFLWVSWGACVCYGGLSRLFSLFWYFGCLMGLLLLDSASYAQSS